MTARNFGSDKRDLAGLPAAASFFSFNLETEMGSKSMNTSLQLNIT